MKTLIAFCLTFFLFTRTNQSHFLLPHEFFKKFLESRALHYNPRSSRAIVSTIPSADAWNKTLQDSTTQIISTTSIPIPSSTKLQIQNKVLAQKDTTKGNQSTHHSFVTNSPNNSSNKQNEMLKKLNNIFISFDTNLDEYPESKNALDFHKENFSPGLKPLKTDEIYYDNPSAETADTKIISDLDTFFPFKFLNMLPKNQESSPNKKHQDSEAKKKFKMYRIIYNPDYTSTGQHEVQKHKGKDMLKKFFSMLEYPYFDFL